MEIRQALKSARVQLGGLAGTNPRLEAEVLLAHALGVARSFLFANPEMQLTHQRCVLFNTLVDRRTAGEPIAYITGEREFWSLALKVTPDVLIPRPETELLVETALNLAPSKPGYRVADLGTGSGAIALALASERPLWEVHATDLSEAAINVARENAQRLGLDTVNFHCCSWGHKLSGKFQLLVSNPPYICAADPHLSVGDCRYEPETALVSGDDGLMAIKAIAGEACLRLTVGGHLILEHGFDQGLAVSGILDSHGFNNIVTIEDLAGHDRVTLGQLPFDV